MKEENIINNYETIDTVKQRVLLQTTRNLGRLLTEEEFNEIIMVYKKVIDRLWNKETLKWILKNVQAKWKVIIIIVQSVIGK